MWHLLLHAASLTLLLQGPLFLFAVAASIRQWVSSARRPVPAGGAAPALTVLEPLTCDGCHTTLALREPLTSCPQCGDPIVLPDAYEDNARIREASQRRLGEAIRYLRKATRLGSRGVTVALIAAGLWLLATPVIVMINEGSFKVYEPVFAALGPGLYVLLGTLLLWELTLLIVLATTRGSPRELPAIRRSALRSQIGTCSTCRGPIEYADGDMGVVCGYCGTQTFRVRIPLVAAKRDRRPEERVLSLEDAKGIYDAGLGDFLMVPALTFAILATGVAMTFIVAIPYLLFDWLFG